MTAFGRIVAVSRSPAHGFSKFPQPSIRLIAGQGVEDDAHLGATTQHLYRKRLDPTQPNLCQVHLLHAEVLDDLRARGFAIDAGQLGENILTHGLDLLGLPQGTRLHLGAHAIVTVTGVRTPCQRINRFRAGLKEALLDYDASGEKVRKAGIMGVVVHGGDIAPNDAVIVELPAHPFQKLRPV